MSIGSHDSSALLTPTSEYELPWSEIHNRSASDASNFSNFSNDAQEIRHPRFPDLTGHRGSAAGQHDLVVQAQKGLGPTLSQGQDYRRKRDFQNYDLQTQARYGLGPSVSLKELVEERRGRSVQHDLLSQAVYGHGMTVPVSQQIVEGPKATKYYNLSTQAALVHGDNVNLRNPYGNKKAYESFDLSSQFRKGL